MKQWLVWSAVIVMVFSVEAVAARTVRLELNDGSIVQGEIVSVAGGVYTLKSGILGIIKIDEAKIRTIGMMNQSPGEAPGPGTTQAQVSQLAQALLDRMTGDEEIMRLIPALANDPDMQAVLNDQDIMNAVRAGDIQALTSNPRFMKLLDKPAIRSIIEKSGQ